jgi:hypothetical protein
MARGSELVDEPDRLPEAGERGIGFQDREVLLGGHTSSLPLGLRLHVDDLPQGGYRVGGPAQSREDAGERPLHLAESPSVVSLVKAAPTQAVERREIRGSLLFRASVRIVTTGDMILARLRRVSMTSPVYALDHRDDDACASALALRDPRLRGL